MKLTKEQKALVDELGALDEKIRPVAPLIARAESIKKEIRGWMADEPADVPFLLSGTRFSASVSAAPPQRFVLVQKLAKILGAKKTLELATVTIKAAEELLPAVQLPAVLDSAPGSRRISTQAMVELKKAA